MGALRHGLEGHVHHRVHGGHDEGMRLGNVISIFYTPHARRVGRGYLAPPLGELAAPISREAQTERALRPPLRPSVRTGAPPPLGGGKALWREMGASAQKGAAYPKLDMLRL